MIDEDPKDEKIFELNQEIKHLRGQITYLQEELASVEDILAKEIDRAKIRIEKLEQELGDAYFKGE
jgi:predicted  nucleic acid-binding Zn-ribbon protein|tara:strand:- start:640 stop:837 length:198 start_codon:yes stop_codon:yes gene_type:complete